MKNKILLIITSFFSVTAMACDLCKSNQPKGFEDITHGEGPTGDVDYIIMWSAIVIVSYTLIMSVKYLIKPNEREQDHIKNLIVEDIIVNSYEKR